MTETLTFFPKFNTIKVSIGESDIEIINHFSFRLSMKFIRESEETKDFRNAFIESVYDMYTHTIGAEQESDSDKLPKYEFIRIEESELTKIFEAILNNDGTTLEVYQRIECVDQYERYYKALKKLFQQSTQMIGQSIKKSVEGFKSIIKPVQMYKIDHLITPINDLITPMDNLINAIRIESPAIQFNEKFKESFAFAESIQRTSSIFHNQLTGIIGKLDYISGTFTSIISNSLQPTFDMLASINTGLEHVNTHFKYRHQTLKNFGWWYLSGFDEELLENIYVNRDKLTKEDVDQLICNYYRENKCRKLKKMVRSWEGLEYFQTRKIDIQQIRVIHGQKYYNSSVTLLTILIEGIARDFIKLQTGQGYYRFSKVRKELRTEVENNYELSLLEFRVADHVLETIEDVFGGSFDPSSPQNTPDYKRDKRLHGQALGKQNESDSLKLFLQLNELYNLFSSIENQGREYEEILV